MSVVEAERPAGSDSGIYRAKREAEAAAEKLGELLPPEVEITIKVRVEDQRKLLEYARRRMRASMGDPFAKPVNLADAVLQAAFECNENPPPSDYGLSVISTHTVQKIVEHGTCSRCKGLILLRDAQLTSEGLIGKECGCQKKT